MFFQRLCAANKRCCLCRLITSFAVEVKWSDRVPQTLGELRGLNTLALKHPLIRNPLVTTRSYTGRAEIDGMVIDFMPVALYCYVIARQVLVS